MAYHNILSKLDRAIAAYLISEEVGTAGNVFPAKRSKDRESPCVVAWSERAAETAPGTGTFTVTASIIVRSIATADAGEDPDDVAAASDALLAAVADALTPEENDQNGERLADAITAAARAEAAANPKNADLADFTCLYVTDKGPEAAFEDETGDWIDTLNKEIVCCPSALAE